MYSPESEAESFGAAERWLAYLREPGNQDSVLGSAVVIAADGYLVTDSSLVTGVVEVVLADGTNARPIIVAVDESTGIALLKVPQTGESVAEFTPDRLQAGEVVLASGFDSQPGSAGRVSGQITATEDPNIEDSPRVRGPASLNTDIPLVPSLVGGALVDSDGSLAGILTPGTDDDGINTFRAISTWYIDAWLSQRQERLHNLQADSGGWDAIALPGGWSVRYPQGWQQANVTSGEDRYRAEILPSDPDSPIQIEISVEPNSAGTDPEAFFSETFADRPNATLWGFEEIGGNALVRLVVDQEGAVVDVAYLLDPDFQIAISMTTGFAPGVEPHRVELSRDYFEALLQTLSR